jgi:Tfp pilus assembly PilM family ATPase
MSLFSSLHHASPPGVAVEVTSARVSAAAVDWRGGKAVVTAHAAEALPEGALIPSLTAVNVYDRGPVMQTLAQVLDQVGRPRRIGLIVPDLVSKVSLVRFEQVPARVSDLDQLVRWQVRKAAPFPIEDAQVSYAPAIKAADGQEFIVSVAKRSVVEEYEGLCAEAGAHAGIVDISTFSVINAVLASGEPGTRNREPGTADWLLVHMAADCASIAILRGPHVIFFRNRTAETEGTLADLVHQTAMYYEDRLKGGGFARVVLAGGSGPHMHGDVDQVRRKLQDRLGETSTRIESVNVTSSATLADRISVSGAMGDTLAPLVGLLLRDVVRGEAA